MRKKNKHYTILVEILKGSPYVSEPTRELISNLYLSNNNNDTSAISLAP